MRWEKKQFERIGLRGATLFNSWHAISGELHKQGIPPGSNLGRNAHWQLCWDHGDLHEPPANARGSGKGKGGKEKIEMQERRKKKRKKPDAAGILGVGRRPTT